MGLYCFETEYVRITQGLTLRNVSAIYLFSGYSRKKVTPKSLNFWGFYLIKASWINNNHRHNYRHYYYYHYFCHQILKLFMLYTGAALKLYQFNWSTRSPVIRRRSLFKVSTGTLKKAVKSVNGVVLMSLDLNIFLIIFDVFIVDFGQVLNVH